MAVLRNVTFSTVLLAVLFGPYFSAAARAETETRKVDVFDEVTLAGSGRLEITVGPEHSVVLEADAETLKRVKTKVRGSHLVIAWDDDSDSFFDWFKQRKNRRGELVARVSLPHLDEGTIAGSGDMRITGLNGGDTELVVAGSGSVRAEGNLDELELSINGSGEARLQNVTVKEADVTINGSGDVTVNVTEGLDATINGSGSIRYLGDPTDVDTAVHGSGSIRKADRD